MNFKGFFYKDLLLNLVKAELKVRYQGSWLGMMWSLLNPAAQIVLYIFVFSVVFRSGLKNYPLYLVSGLIYNILFSQALTQGAESFVGNGGLLSKIKFPRILVPLATFSTNVYFWLMSLVIFILAYPLIGGKWSWIMMLSIPVSLIFLVFVGAFTIVIAVWTVDFRDLKHLVEIIMMFLFWLTPIPYSLNQVPTWAAHWLYLNPMTWFVVAFHDIFYSNTFPSIKLWLGMGTWALALLALAIFVYLRNRDYLVERL